jgi:hypothetical protein
MNIHLQRIRCRYGCALSVPDLKENCVTMIAYVFFKIPQVYYGNTKEVKPMSPVFTADFFKSYINTVFKLCPDGVLPLELKLIEIREQNQPVIDEFTLIFTGPLDRVARESTYRIEHESLEPFEMFIGPFFTPMKKDAVYYQAVFTRFKEDILP